MDVLDHIRAHHEFLKSLPPPGKAADAWQRRVKKLRGGCRESVWDLVAAALYSHSGTSCAISDVLQRRLATELRKRGYKRPRTERGACVFARGDVDELVDLSD